MAPSTPSMPLNRAAVKSGNGRLPTIIIAIETSCNESGIFHSYESRRQTKDNLRIFSVEEEEDRK